MTFNLTQTDIAKLIHEPSTDIRCDITEKICKGFNQNRFTIREREIAKDIFKLLLKDTEMRVRKTLAEELQYCPNAPVEIVKALTEESADISNMILENSPVLTDEDLIHIVEATQNVVRLVAIASRKALGPRLSEALIDKQDTTVTRKVVQNEGAELDELCLEKLLQAYQGNHSVLEDLVCRGGLPYSYSERLFNMVGNLMKKQLTKRYRLNWSQNDRAIQNARELSTLRFMSPWMAQSDILELVNHMEKNKRLTNSILIRSLCIGDLRFFQTAVAKRACLPIANAKALLADHGFDALYKKAGLPEDFKDSVRVLYRMASEETSDNEYHTEDISVRLVSRIVQEGHDKTIESMPYLLSMIGRSVTDVQGVH